MYHPEALYRHAHDRIEAFRQEAEIARHLPPLRQRLADTLYALATRLEPTRTRAPTRPAKPSI